MKKILLTLIIFLALPVTKVNAASVSFYTSGGGDVYTGSQVTVVVYANSSDTYNAVDLSLTYSNLTLLGMSADGGWTAVAGPTDSGGSVSFSGALLGSSASGSHAVLDLRFRMPYYASSASISSSGTIALNDGYGTQVSGGGNTVSFNVVNPPAAAPTVPANVVVGSGTHPDQTKWSQTKDAELSWNKQDGVDGFSYTLDTNIESNPDETAEGIEMTKTFPLTPGINYFHIRAHNTTGWSNQTIFTILYDNQAPDPFGIAKLKTADGGKYKIYFATNDSYSGVDYFTVSVDGIDMGKQTSGYEVDKSANKVTVTAYDKVGNYISEELVLDEPITIPNTNTTETTGTQLQISTGTKNTIIVVAVLVLIALISVANYVISSRRAAKKLATVAAS